MQALKLLFSSLRNGDRCWNGRGGACVPARTSAQRRFHTNQYTHCVRGMNDGCALAERHGRAHRRRPYQTPSNHAVCHYPIGVILSIAQGWQVQRCLPWVMMQMRILPPWGLYFFSSHIITTRGEQMVSYTQIDFKKYNTDGRGSRPTTLPRVDFAALNQPWAIKSTTPMVLVHVHRFINQ